MTHEGILGEFLLESDVEVLINDCCFWVEKIPVGEHKNLILFDWYDLIDDEFGMVMSVLIFVGFVLD